MTQPAKPKPAAGFKIDVIFTAPQLVWLRAKANAWGCSEGAALRRLVDMYRVAERAAQQRAEAQGKEAGP